MILLDIIARLFGYDVARIIISHLDGPLKSALSLHYVQQRVRCAHPSEKLDDINIQKPYHGEMTLKTTNIILGIDHGGYIYYYFARDPSGTDWKLTLFAATKFSGIPVWRRNSRDTWYSFMLDRAKGRLRKKNIAIY